MNKSFKVVFSKARSALMVVNEATSSIQAKGTKTVISVAAAMVAGGAVAANVYVGDGDELAWGVHSDGTKAEVELKAGAVYSDAYDGKNTLSPVPADAIIYQQAGKVTVAATEKLGQDVKVNELTGGTLVLSAANSATDGSQKNTTVTYTGTAAVGAATIQFGNGGTGTYEGISKFQSDKNAPLTLGDVGTGPHPVAQQTTVVVDTGVNGTISAGTGDLTLANVAFNNNGKLTLEAGKVTFGSDYAAQGGKLAVTGAADVLKNFTGTNVLIGTDAEYAKTATETFGGVVTVSGAGATFTAADMLVAADGLHLTSGASAKVTTATVKTDGVINVDADSTAEIGKLIVNGAATAVTNAGTLTGTELVANNTSVVTNSGSLKFDSVTVTPATTDTAKADLTITDNKTASLGAVNVTASEDFGAKLTIDGTGTTTAGAVTLSGYTVNQSIQNAEFEINNTNAETGFTAESLTVNKGGIAKLASGNAVITGDVTVAESGSLTATSGSLTVKGTMTLAAKAADFTNGATLTVGALNNSVAITSTGDVTVGGLEGAKSVNAGTITASANTVTVKGDFDNQLYVGTTSKKSEANLTAQALVVDGATFTNTGVVNATNITLQNGAVYKTALDYTADGSYTEKTTTTKGAFNVNEGSTLDITALNDKSKADGAVDRLKLGNAVTLDGGVLTVAGAATDAVNVVLTEDLTVKGATTQTFGSILAATAGKGLVLQDTTSGSPAVTVGTLEEATGKVEVNGGVLTVTDKFYTATPANVKVGADGELYTTGTALGLKIDEKGVASFEQDATSKKSFGGLQNSGFVTVDATGNLAAASNLQTITDKFSNGTDFGMIDLTGIKLDWIKAESDGAYTFNSVKDLNGVLVDQLKTATVKDVNAGLYGRYGNAILATGTTALAVDKTTVLTGTGNLVQVKDGTAYKLAGLDIKTGGEFIYDAAAENSQASVGAVTMADGTGFYVDNGQLTVEDDIGSSTASGGNVEVGATAGLLVNGDVYAASVDVDGTMTMGQYTDAKGVKSPAVATIGQLDVSETGTFTTAGDVSVRTGNIEGTAAFQKLTTTDTVNGLNVSGKVSVAQLAAASKITARATLDPAVTEIFTKENGYMIDVADAAKVSVGTLAADATVAMGDGVVLALGETATADDAVAMLNRSGYGLGKADVPDATTGEIIANKDAPLVQTAVLATTLKADGTHQSIAGTIGKKDAAASSLLMIDADKVDTTGKTKLFTNAVTFSKVVVDNVDAHDKINVTDITGVNADAINDNGFTGDLLMEAKLVNDTTAKTQTLEIAMADKKALVDEGLGVVGMNAAWAMFDQNKNKGNSSSVKFANWLFTSANHTSVGAYQTAAKDVASLGATTGVQTMTMDAVNQMGETVADRVSLLTQRAAGVNVWAAANGGMFEAKSLFDGAGYESDIYSGVLGVDYQFACNAVLGAALTIGTADTDNKNSTVKASTDSDLVGFSVYTSKTFADVIGVSADIGYLTASNDVTANGYGQAWKFSQDTDAFTIGLRTEVLAEVGAVKLVPHIGIRYTALSTDGFEAGYKTEIDDQNVFQMPVGVTVSGDFQTGDWTVAPKFDLSVVPTFGDKDADLKLGITGVNATDDLAVRVIDSNPVQATLGVNATNGAWGFGLNYKLGVGSDDRMNNTFNVNVRYAF